MRVLFAVNNEKISESIIKKYQLDYKEIISAKNVYYFNAIIKELQRNRNYDRIVISEDLEPYSNRNYEMIDKFLFDKLDNISDEASNNTDSEIPIILICTDRRDKGEPILTKLFSIGLYSALIGSDRTIENLCTLINKPRSKREAKAYYKIFVDDADYKAESTAEVNEVEVQNILNHFKKLGKNENAYVTSFNDVASQYTEEQLKLIVGYLPLNVRAVLEEESPAYQKLMLESVKGKIKEKKEKALTTKNINVPNRTNNNIDLINKALQKPRMTKPVVIPSSMDANNVKKVYKQQDALGNLTVKPTVVSGELRKRKIDSPSTEQLQTNNYTSIEPQDVLQDLEPMNYDENVTLTQATEGKAGNNERTDYDIFDEDIFQTQADNITNNIEPQIQKEDAFEGDITESQAENDIPKKRGRGRPPKVKPISTEQPSLDGGLTTQTPAMPKRGRGRPRKVAPQPVLEKAPEAESEDTEINLFDLDNDNNGNGTDSSDVKLFGLDEAGTVGNDANTDIDLFGLDNSNTEEANSDIDLFNLDEELNSDNVSNQGNKATSDINLFDLDDEETNSDVDLFDLSNDDTDSSINQNTKFSTDSVSSENIGYNPNNSMQSNNNQTTLAKTENSYNDGSIASLLTSDKKIVAFVGTSKNGTSFLVNNVAALLSSKGINTAILDLTKNKNAYYIYTQNDEALRTQSSKCIEGLRRGAANGINAGKNLMVYTTQPNEDAGIEDYSNILQTLVKNHSLVILDCDFDTNLNYFAQAQEIYLVQTYDILTIQPLTAFVRELEDKNVINPNKLRIVVNKVLKVRNLNEKMVIGGISKYNSPDMTYQKDLFDINNIMYTVIPFEDQTYAKYLEGLVTCNISLNGYSRGLLEALDVLGDMVYPLISRKQYGSKEYNNYNSYGRNNTNQSQFNSSIDNTLNKMRNSF